jgi:serine phosphatase RsbU (regulator of sigma subunit)
VVAHALELVGADRVVLTRAQHRGPAAAAGAAVEFEPSMGVVSEVARSRLPQVDGNAVHVPVALGPRLFGVLSAFRTAGEMSAEDVELLGRLARSSAAAMANAVDFDRERRIARALTRGFVPDSLPRLDGWDLGVLYEPAAGQPAGGDVYGAWEVPDGEIALLIGDVAGKGVENAALSAMARFFIEARSWHSDSPAETLRQANTLLRERLPSDTFVTAFLGLLGPSGLLYASAGHQPPLILPADGVPREAGGGGLPLGVDPDATYEDLSLPLGHGDALLAFTDGLVEARSQGELFGEQRVRETATMAASGDMQDLVTAVHLAAKRFSGGLQDDAVLLALRRR